MISGISGVGHMTGVLAVQPYKGAKQNTEYAAPASKSGMRPAQKVGAVYPGRTGITCKSGDFAGNSWDCVCNSFPEKGHGSGGVVCPYAHAVY